MAAEDRGPLMHARIGMLRALNRHVERAFSPDRKEPALGTAEAGKGSMTTPGPPSPVWRAQADHAARCRALHHQAAEARIDGGFRPSLRKKQRFYRPFYSS